jgi:two-component system, NarL family, sensor histidine kinase DesK
MSRGRLGQFFAIVLLVFMFPTVALFWHTVLPWPRFAASVVALALSAGLYVWFWLGWPRSGTRRTTLGVVLGLTALGVTFNLASGVETVNPFIAPIIVGGFALPARWGALVTVALTAFSLVLALALTPPTGGATAVELVALIGFVAVQLLLAGAAAIGVARLLATMRELREARETIARLAVAEERTRFARDLHDLLGHSLSLITLKGELAAQLIDTDPGRARAETRELIGVAREALREVRDTITGYRRPTLATELAAARSALGAAGIELRLDERLGALTGPAEAALAWTIREGVTNVVRHSRARRCTVLLVRTADGVLGEVLDDGPGGPSTVAGNGLRGVGERAAELGGELTAGRLPEGGFRLRVVIPASEPAAPSRPGAPQSREVPLRARG